MRGTFLPVGLALGLLALSSAQAANPNSMTLMEWHCIPGKGSNTNCSFALRAPDSCKEPTGGNTGDGAPCLKSVTCKMQKGGNSATCMATYTVQRSR